VRILRPGAWTILAVVIVELCAREIARRSIFEMLLGIRPGLWTLTVIAVIAATAGIAASPGADVQDGRPGSRRRIAPFLFAALFAAGVAAQIHLGARLQSDGFYYFAYLRSIVFDRDVEFSNDYKLLGLGDKAHLFTPTATGYAQSAWTIGPAIVCRRSSPPRTPSRTGSRRPAPMSARTESRIRIGRLSASPGCSTPCLAAGSPIG